MRLKLWLSLSILISSGLSCNGNLPVRPELDLCMVSAPDKSEADPEPFQGCLCSNAQGVSYRLTWKECDKHVAFDQVQLEAFSEYVLELEKKVNSGCRLNSTIASQVVGQIKAQQKAILMSAPK